MIHLEPLLSPVQTIARKAGQATLAYYDKAKTEFKNKADGSPVTLADQASEDIILKALDQLTPHIPIVAEEQAEAGFAPQMTQSDTFWLVDPLDGTREFIKGTPDFTVNIGLVVYGTPVLGVVYIPAKDDMYYGGRNLGAYFNGQAISPNTNPDFKNLSVIASRNSPVKGKRDQFLQQYNIGIGDYVMRGSSLKFCLIADGQADLYPRFVPTYEWDTCAAHALLLEVGGDIIDFTSGKRLTYGKYENLYLNGSLITANKATLKHLGVEAF